MSGVKNSKQRDAVYADLLGRYDHPTAEEVYLSVKKQLPSISLATVYRNLKTLEADGRIIKITTGDSDRFDGHIQKHHHFMCGGCKKVLDLEFKNELNIDSEAQKGFDGEISGHSLLFFGLCAECKQSQI